MTVTRKAIAPEYNNFYISGTRDGVLSFDADYGGLAANQESITVPASYWVEADTHLTFGPVAEVTRPEPPNFDGTVNTPDKVLIVYDALVPTYASTPVSSTKTRVRIWMDHPTEPEHIVIGWGE